MSMSQVSHPASRGFSATAELLVLVLIACRNVTAVMLEMPCVFIAVGILLHSKTGCTIIKIKHLK